MRLDWFLRHWLSPRVIVSGDIDRRDMEAIERMGPGQVSRVMPGVQVQTVPHAPLHIHLNGRKPRRTASMGPTLKGRVRRG